MSVDILRDKIIDNISKYSAPMDESVPELVHKSISESITEYITNNVTVQVTNSSSLYVYTWRIIGVMSDIPIPTDLDSWISSISEGIKSSFFLKSDDIYVYPIDGQLAFPNCNIISDQSELYNYHMNNYNDPHFGVMQIVSNWIISSLMPGSNQDIMVGTAGYDRWRIIEVNT